MSYARIKNRVLSVMGEEGHAVMEYIDQLKNLAKAEDRPLSTAGYAELNRVRRKLSEAMEENSLLNRALLPFANLGEHCHTRGMDGLDHQPVFACDLIHAAKICDREAAGD